MFELIWSWNVQIKGIIHFHATGSRHGEEDCRLGVYDVSAGDVMLVHDRGNRQPAEWRQCFQREGPENHLCNSRPAWQLIHYWPGIYIYTVSIKTCTTVSKKTLDIGNTPVYISPQQAVLILLSATFDIQCLLNVHSHNIFVFGLNDSLLKYTFLLW